MAWQLQAVEHSRVAAPTTGQSPKCSTVMSHAIAAKWLVTRPPPKGGLYPRRNKNFNSADGERRSMALCVWLDGQQVILAEASSDACVRILQFNDQPCSWTPIGELGQFTRPVLSMAHMRFGLLLPQDSTTLELGYFKILLDELGPAGHADGCESGASVLFTGTTQGAVAGWRVTMAKGHTLGKAHTLESLKKGLLHNALTHTRQAMMGREDTVDGEERGQGRGEQAGDSKERVVLGGNTEDCLGTKKDSAATQLTYSDPHAMCGDAIACHGNSNSASMSLAQEGHEDRDSSGSGFVQVEELWVSPSHHQSGVNAMAALVMVGGATAVVATGGDDQAVTAVVFGRSERGLVEWCRCAVPCAHASAVKGVILCEAGSVVFLCSVGLDQFVRVWQVHIRKECGAAKSGDMTKSVHLVEVSSFKVDVCEPSCVHGYIESAAREACTERDECRGDVAGHRRSGVGWTLMVAGRGMQILRVKLP
jgi:hypothetical protein